MVDFKTIPLANPVPATLIEDPILQKPRMERDEPRDATHIVDRSEPHLVLLRMETDDPKVPKDCTDK